MVSKYLNKVVGLSCLALLLLACGGGGGGGGSDDAPSPAAGPLPPANELPVFTSAANASAPENQTATSYTAVAVDPDGDPVTYSLGGTDQNRFFIDTLSGVVTFASAPDFEDPTDNDTDNRYEIEINADDGRGGNSVLAVEISVTDVARDLAFEVSYPTDNAILDGEATQTRISGNVIDREGGVVTPADINSLSVNGHLATFSLANPARWAVVVPIQPGMNNVDISFVDGNSQVTNASRILFNNAILINPRGVAFDSTNDRLLIADPGKRALLSVDLASGNRTTIADNFKGGSIYVEPSDLALDDVNNRVLVIDRGLETLFAVDLTSGNRTTISGGGAGSGPGFLFPEFVALDSANNRIFVADQAADGVYSVNLADGARTILSNSATGTGPALDLPADLVVDSVNNRLLLVDWGVDALFSIDIANGNRSIVSGAATGTGDVFQTPIGLVLDSANNRVLVTDTRRLIAVDLATGNRSDLSDVTIGNVNYSSLNGVDLDSAGNRVLVVDSGRDTVLEIATSDGSQAILSNSSAGAGFNILTPEGIVLDLPNNRALVIDDGFNWLHSIDLENGNRMQVSGGLLGSGTTLVSPSDVTLDNANDRALVIDNFRDALFAIDLTSGDRSTLSSDTVGSGSIFEIPRLVDFDAAADRALVVDASGSALALVEVELATGNRTTISDPATGIGPSFIFPTGLLLDSANNRALVADQGVKALIAVDLATGNRTILSDSGTGTGPDFTAIRGIALDSVNNRVLATNAILFCCSGEASLFAIDLGNGNRTILSDSVTGGGSNFSNPEDVEFDAAHNRAFVSDKDAGLIFVVDLDTGERAVASK